MITSYSNVDNLSLELGKTEKKKKAMEADWKQLLCWHESGSQRFRCTTFAGQWWQYLQNATSACPANWSNFHTKPRCKSQTTWFLFQPPVLVRSYKKFLRLNACERVLNLPSPGGWMGNGKAELSRSVGAQYLGDNQICLLPSEIAGVWVQVPPLLFHRFIVLCHGGGTSVGEDRGGGRSIFLTGSHKGLLVDFLPLEGGSLSLSKIPTSGRHQMVPG